MNTRNRWNHALRRLLMIAAVPALPFAFAPGAVGGTPSADRSETIGSELSFGEAMDVLYQWLGPWTVVERHYDAMGRVVAETKGTEEGRWAMAERAIRRIYRNAAGDASYVAEGTFTYNELDHVFEGFWVDNRSTHGPSFSRGRWNADAHTMIYEVEHAAPNGRRERFRVVERFINDKRRESTTYRLRGDELVKVLDMVYERSGPCPERRAQWRIILDGLED